MKQLHAHVEKLQARLAALEARLGKDSTNSSQPPSTEHPHAQPPRPQPKSRRPSGGQPGHARPRLIACSALLMACFRQSKRRAAAFLGLILHQPARCGWMVAWQNRAAEAMRPAYDELARRLPDQAVLRLDESPTKEGQAKAWVWTFGVAAFTVFACRTSRAAAARSCRGRETGLVRGGAAGDRAAGPDEVMAMTHFLSASSTFLAIIRNSCPPRGGFRN